VRQRLPDEDAARIVLQAVTYEKGLERVLDVLVCHTRSLILEEIQSHAYLVKDLGEAAPKPIRPALPVSPHDIQEPKHV